MKTLVCYFSCSGVTKAVATRLAQVANADLYEIKPVEPYTAADLDWTNKQSRSSVEMNDLKSRPAFVKDLENAEQYDVVYVGFPIWWYTAPTIINTFIETYGFKGKVDNLKEYDVVYIGFPIWWYTAPTIINTFIEAHDFTGKTLVPFATSGGSNIKKACEDLKAAYPNYKFGEGKLLNRFNKDEVEAWAASIK